MAIYQMSYSINMIDMIHKKNTANVSGGLMEYQSIFPFRLRGKVLILCFRLELA